MTTLKSLLQRFVWWFDTTSGDPASMTDTTVVDWFRVIPFALLHLACVGVFFVDFRWTLVGLAVALYVIRMFAITGFYHRYFSHRTFKTSRPAQFAFALLGASAAQRGPLWWAAHHRRHHRHSDTELDPHSPREHGFWWAHMGWITAPGNFPTAFEEVRDLEKYPELRFLDRFDLLVPLLLATGLFVVGGFEWLLWGFFVSTVVLFHCTCFINSLAHQMGSRRFETDDDSRNSLILALLTFGEGWHNNHHKYPGSVRQGFYWWEVDLTYYGLLVLRSLGIISDLRKPPQRVYDSA